MSSNLTKYHICREVLPTMNLRLCRIVSCGSALLIPPVCDGWIGQVQVRLAARCIARRRPWGHLPDAGGQVSPSGGGEREDRTIGINGSSQQYRVVLRGRFHA
jgi:hypothetical protein